MATNGHNKRSRISKLKAIEDLVSCASGKKKTTNRLAYQCSNFPPLAALSSENSVSVSLKCNDRRDDSISLSVSHHKRFATMCSDAENRSVPSELFEKTRCFFCKGSLTFDDFLKCGICSKSFHKLCYSISFTNTGEVFCKECVTSADGAFDYERCLNRLQSFVLQCWDYFVDHCEVESSAVFAFAGNIAPSINLDPWQLVLAEGIERYALSHLASNDVTDLPVYTMGDGNCLFSAVSLAHFGTSNKQLLCELRVRTILEMVSNLAAYDNAILKNDPLVPVMTKECIINLCKYGESSYKSAFYPLSSVLGRSIVSVYCPIVVGDGTGEFYNFTVSPLCGGEESPIRVLWTRASDLETEVDIWIPNHICLLVSIPKQTFSLQEVGCKMVVTEWGVEVNKTSALTERTCTLNVNECASDIQVNCVDANPPIVLVNKNKEKVIYSSMLSISQILNFCKLPEVPLCTVPTSEGICYLENFEENIQKCKERFKNGGETSRFYNDEGKEVIRGKLTFQCRIRHGRNFKMVDLPLDHTVYSVNRIFLKGRDQNVKRVVTRVTQIQPSVINFPFLVETQTPLDSRNENAQSESHVEAPKHGNSKYSQQPYSATNKTVINLAKEKLKEGIPPRVVYRRYQGFRNRKQVYNIMAQVRKHRRREEMKRLKNEKDGNNTHVSSASSNDVQTIISSLPNGHVNFWIHLHLMVGSNGSGFIRKSVQSKHKYVICYTNRQIKSFRRVCRFPGQVSTIDTTYGSGIYITFFAYRNIALCDNAGNSPLFIGPVMFHEVEKDSEAIRDFLLDVKEALACEPLVIGSDEDSVIERRLHECMPNSYHLLGREHLKWNLNESIRKKNVPLPLRISIASDVFGPSRFADLPALLECCTKEEFDKITECYYNKWSAQGAQDFATFFKNKKSVRFFKEGSRAAWQQAGLNESHWQQGHERINRDIKAMRDKTSHLQLEDGYAMVRRLIDEKELEEDRAMQGEGDFRLSESMKKFYVSSGGTYIFIYNQNVERLSLLNTTKFSNLPSHTCL